MNQLEKVGHETMVFMRGNYRLDEIGDGKDELKFKQGAKTILTIYLHEDKYTFLVIFGKKEREVFDARRDEFSKYILDYYDGSKTYHDGKWMFIDVTTPEQLEEVKKLVTAVTVRSVIVRMSRVMQKGVRRRKDLPSVRNAKNFHVSRLHQRIIVL